MAMPYQEKPEDRLLMDKPFRVWRGMRIDTRWAGGWLTPEGEYIPVDYARGVTHETIAEDRGSQIMGSGSIMTRPPIMRIFDVVKWMRITYFEYSSFCVELKGSLVSYSVSVSRTNERVLTAQNRRRQLALVKFVRDFTRFEEYYLNDIRFDSFKKFRAGIWNDAVAPRAVGCIGDDPDHPSCGVALAPEWRTETAVAIARGMCASGDFGAMPVLADALEDAGCDDYTLLDHCRGPCPHVRGCWVVDLVLGKE